MRTRLSAIVWAILVCAILGGSASRCRAINRDGVFLNGNYINNTTQNVYAGQQLNFSMAYHTHPYVYPLTDTITIQWQIDGRPIKSYVTGTIGYFVDLPPADLTQVTFTCYLLEHGPGTVVCNVTEAISDGTYYYTSGGCSLNIIKPTGINLVPTSGTIYYDLINNTGIIHVGDQNSPGMSIATTGALSPSNRAMGGQFNWCQVIHSYDTFLYGFPHAHCGTDPSLDEVFPYGGGVLGFLGDSPEVDGAPVLGFDPALSISISATTYQIWNCGLSGAIWVPIASLDWSASGSESGGTLTSTGPTATNIQTDLILPPVWGDTLTL